MNYYYRWKAVFALLLLLVPAILLAQTTRYVPTQYSTVASAISASGNGDTIDISGSISEPQINISKSLVIRGHGISNTIISCSNPVTNSGAFSLSGFKTVFFKDMTICDGYYGIYINHCNLILTNCKISDNKCGIYNQSTGNINISYSIISNNNLPQASFNQGAGIYNAGTMQVNFSSITNNSLTGGTWLQGAGIFNNGNMVINSCLIANNTLIGQTSAWLQGAGIHNSSSSKLMIINSTICNNSMEGNTSWAQGAGIFAGDSVYINNCTINNNAINTSGNWRLGAGLYSSGSRGVIKIKGTILAGNLINGVNNSDYSVYTSGIIISYGYNLIGQSTAPAFNATGDITGQNPMLDTLKDNGGPTATLALFYGSPAINAGSNTDITGNQVTTDQRNFQRGNDVDIGAYEWNGFNISTNQISDNICINRQNQVILKIEVAIPDTFTLNSFIFNTLGTSIASDILNAKLYYSGNNKSFSLMTSTQYGITIDSPNGNFQFDSTMVLSAGFHYFWLTYNISTNASAGNSFDAYCPQIIMRDTARIPDDTMPSGNRTIPQVHAAFQINDSAQCFTGNNFVLTNNSSTNSGNLTALWNFGDNSTSTNYTVTHNYATSDTFNIKLRVIIADGCLDSTEKTVIVFPEPQARFVINNQVQCLNVNRFIFTDSSTIVNGSIAGKIWNFGDGQTDTSANITHSFLNYDSFAVKLTVTSDMGCKDSVIKNVIVKPIPKANFIAYDSSQCLERNNFAFTNKSSSVNSSFNNLWNFGDSLTSALYNPMHQYLYADTFTVMLIVTDTFSCRDTFTKRTWVLVHPEPLSNFTINDSSQCLSVNNFVLNNTSTIKSGIFIQKWDFGDGKDTISYNTNHVYSISDSFRIKLLLISDWGCKDSSIKAVYVHPNPTVQFNVNDTTQCFSSNNYVFSNQSSYPLNFPGKFEWTFGEGSIDTATNPVHSYIHADTFSVRLTASFDIGCKDSMKRTIIVFPNPKTDFTINDNNQCLSGNNFTLSNQSIITKPATLNFLWNFGDLTTDTLVSPVHSYNSAGVFNIKLSTISNQGCTDSLIKSVNIFPQPFPAFSVNDSTQCLKANLFSFINASSGVKSYFWNFGDLTTDTTSQTAHHYLVADSFVVKLVATTLDGCKDSVEKTLFVFPEPKAVFMINDTTQCFSGNLFKFSNSTIGASGFNWDFGDITVIDTNTNPSHSYTNAGTFLVKLHTYAKNGCNDSLIKMVNIYPQPLPAFNLYNPSQCLKANLFNFNNASSGAKSYLWNFGDLTTDTINQPIHHYSVSDTFVVKLFATSKDGCKDSTSKILTVLTSPKAGFTPNDSTQCLSGNQFIFSNSTNRAKNFIWNFDDGSTDTGSNPVYSYTSAGTYFVNLKAQNINGCMDSITRKIEVFPMPTAGFTINSNPQYLPGNNYIFSNQSNFPSGSINSFWNFGDGDTSFLKDPAHSYKTMDTFDVKLVVLSNDGCKDSVTQKVWLLYPLIHAEFLVTDICLGKIANFHNTSIVQNDSFEFFTWDFGDSVQAILRHDPIHLYTDTGSYQVQMVARTYKGFKDTAIHSIHVLPSPNVKITADPDTIVDENTIVTLTANGNFDNIFWYNGSSSLNIDVNKAGLYSVKVLYLNGCDATDSVMITYLPVKSFSAMNVITPNDDGINDFWKIEKIEKYQPCKLVIYNRWGDELYSTSDYQNNWDGKFKGKTLPEGTYYFILVTKDGKEYKGAVNILK